MDVVDVKQPFLLFSGASTDVLLERGVSSAFSLNFDLEVVPDDATSSRVALLSCPVIQGRLGGLAALDSERIGVRRRDPVDVPADPGD